MFIQPLKPLFWLCAVIIRFSSQINNNMEIQIKKLITLRQELITTLSSGGRYGKQKVKSEGQILDDMGELLDEIEGLLDYGNELKIKELQHFKDTTVGLYATDKIPEELFEEVFVHLITEIGMDGEKTFSPMDYEYYNKYFKKGINLITWRLF
jgi:hypothetical protein